MAYTPTWYLILIPVNYEMHLYHIFLILIIMFDVAVIWKGQRSLKWWFFCNLWPFLRRSHHSWSSKSYIFDIHAFHNSLASIWGVMLGFRPFLLVIIWTFSDSKSRNLSGKCHIPDLSAFLPLLLIKALCSDQWWDFQIIDIRKNPVKFCFF